VGLLTHRAGDPDGLCATLTSAALKQSQALAAFEAIPNCGFISFRIFPSSTPTRKPSRPTQWLPRWLCLFEEACISTGC
jgi:hypothetical protein